MSEKDLKRIFRQASEVAKSVPESLREAAFNRALDELLAEYHKGRDASGDNADTEPHLLRDSLDAIEQAAASLGVENLSPEQVAVLLHDRLGVPITPEMVGEVIDRADSLLTTAYRRSGDIYRRIVAGRGEGTVSRGQKSRGGGQASAARPIELLMDLVALGFFTTARTAGDVILYLQRKGFQFTAQQITPVLLRLIQMGILTRERHQGKSAYRAASKPRPKSKKR